MALCCIGSAMGGKGYCTCAGRKSSDRIKSIEDRLTRLERATGKTLPRLLWCPNCRATSPNGRLCGRCDAALVAYGGNIPDGPMIAGEA